MGTIALETSRALDVFQVLSIQHSNTSIGPRLLVVDDVGSSFVGLSQEG